MADIEAQPQATDEFVEQPTSTGTDSDEDPKDYDHEIALIKESEVSYICPRKPKPTLACTNSMLTYHRRVGSFPR